MDRKKLNGIVRARELSQKVMRNIKQNLFFAFVYNALGVPVACGTQTKSIILIATGTYKLQTGSAHSKCTQPHKKERN